VRRRVLGALAGLALLAGCAGPAGRSSAERGGCPTRLLADIPAQFDRTGIRIPVSVNGTRLMLLVDTGATGIGLLSASAAKRAGLTVDPASARTHVALSGPSQTPVVPNVRVEVEGLPTQTGPVAIAPDTTLAGFGDGLIGARILGGQDLELNPFEGRVRFHAVAPGCQQIIPFDGPTVGVRLQQAPNGLLFAPMTLDGTTLLALVDTGASGTLLLDPGVDRLGIRSRVAEAPKGGLAKDWSGNTVQGTPLRFREVLIGPARGRDPVIPYVAAPIRVADAIIGRDYLAQKPIWVSYATVTLFILNRPAPSGSVR